MIENISHDGRPIAIIVSKNYHQDGISFFTDESMPLQLGYMSHPVGHEIVPHVHHPIERETHDTYEVLFVKNGSIRIDFFSYDQAYLESRELSAGDLILLVGAGHGITVLEPTTLIEVKNGPYYAEKDKERFPNPITLKEMNNG